MRINELRDKIDKLGQKYDKNFIVEKNKYPNGQSYIKICEGCSSDNYKIATIDLEIRYGFSVIGISFYKLPGPLKEELFNILTEFARTPEDEREEVKKYQYRLKEKYWWIADKFYEEKTYFNFRTVRETFIDICLGNKEETEHYKTKFTDEEIGAIVEKYDIDLKTFDKIEVE